VIDNHPPSNNDKKFDLLDQLERRYDEVLLQIDQLSERIEAVLVRYKPAGATEEILAKIVVAKSEQPEKQTV
jgi:DNA-binding ferritin-like protein